MSFSVKTLDRGTEGKYYNYKFSEMRLTNDKKPKLSQFIYSLKV